MSLTVVAVSFMFLVVFSIIAIAFIYNRRVDTTSDDSRRQITHVAGIAEALIKKKTYRRVNRQPGRHYGKKI